MRILWELKVRISSGQYCFFASNILVVLPVFHIAQTDVIYLYFMLKGTEAYIKDDTKGLVLWYVIANSIKFIPIFIFIPLVLLKEKRILVCVRNIVLGCILIPVQQLWYRIIDLFMDCYFVSVCIFTDLLG